LQVDSVYTEIVAGTVPRTLSNPLVRGGLLAVGAAVTFGVTTPLIKMLGNSAGPFPTATLLYSGAGLVSVRGVRPRKSREASLRMRHAPRVFAVATIRTPRSSWGPTARTRIINIRTHDLALRHDCSEYRKWRREVVLEVMHVGRFLVVEDDPDVARTMGLILRRHGDVVVVGTASEADVLLGDKSRWSGIFLDIRLPDGSGLDVLRRARAVHPQLPAMVLTGLIYAEAINGAYDLHAEYVVKPVATERIERFSREAAAFSSRLASTVESWMARYGLSEAEGDVLARAAAGQSRKEIAGARGSSELTIKKHAGTILRLTGDESLQAAVARLLRELAGG
jgi:DNA-binding NarL/FixJ family response regulator